MLCQFTSLVSGIYLYDFGAFVVCRAHIDLVVKRIIRI